VDILLVVGDSNEPRYKRIQAARKMVMDIPAPLPPFKFGIRSAECGRRCYFVHLLPTPPRSFFGLGIETSRAGIFGHEP